MNRAGTMMSLIHFTLGNARAKIHTGIGAITPIKKKYINF
jgi:hypothetical protein